MRITRAFAVLVAALLMAAGTLVGANSPASAATPITVKFEAPAYATSTGYGDYYGLYAYAYKADGTKAYGDGTMTVYTKPIGSGTWTPLYSNSGSYLIEGFELAESAEYKAVYSGDKTYAAAESAVLTINVHRGIKYIGKSPRKVCAQVGPLSAPYKNKPVTTYYKIGKKKGWQKGWTFRTNKKSQHCYKITKTKAPKGVKVPKGPKLKASKTVFVKSGGMKKYVDVQHYTY